MIYSLFSFFCRLFGNITDVSIANETEDWTRNDLIRVTIQTKGIVSRLYQVEARIDLPKSQT